MSNKMETFITIKNGNKEAIDLVKQLLANDIVESFNETETSIELITETNSFEEDLLESVHGTLNMIVDDIYFVGTYERDDFTVTGAFLIAKDYSDNEPVEHDFDFTEMSFNHDETIGPLLSTERDRMEQEYLEEL